MPGLTLDVGVKTDPIETRYSYPWLFRLLASEGVRTVQLGTFFELYQLPDAFFHQLRRQAEEHGIHIASLFTAHRELGGFYREEPGFEAVARRNYERLIVVGGLLGADAVGCNPGAVLRDRMGTKPEGTARYLRHMKELMHVARAHGVSWLTIEPMSCLAEPPTLPEEIRAMCEELDAYHAAHPEVTARVGLCTDVAHGYADRDGATVWDNMQLLEASLPWLYELHLKNTDPLFNATFGFSEAERAKGIVDVAAVRDLLRACAGCLPVRAVTGYLEIGGPKTGRDYTDGHLEEALRASLRYLRETFQESRVESRESDPTPDAQRPTPGTQPSTLSPFSRLTTHDSQLNTHDSVFIAPSVMCADLCRLEESVRRLEAVGADLLHFDLMDARFTPNMPVGLTLLEQLRPCTALPYDIHLMVEDNDFFIRQVAPFRPRMISVHVESARHLDRTLALIRDSGALAGAALNPATPLSALDYVTDRLDFVLLMTVNPGFAGQALVPAALRKIAECRAWLDARGLADLPIQVDGNVSFENIPRMVAAGGGILVAGSSSLFHAGGTLAENARRMREGIAEGLAMRPARQAGTPGGPL